MSANVFRNSLSCQYIRISFIIAGCTGTNKYGYIMHLTAPKLLGYGYVTPDLMDNMCSLAIVRNPYTRMVSIYGYNRFGESESFPEFLKRWKKLMRHYIERGEKEEWYTPCHCLPQFEYTHFNGELIISSCRYLNLVLVLVLTY